MSILKIIAIAIYVVAWVVAIMTGQALNPVFLAVMSFATLSVLAGVVP